MVERKLRLVEGAGTPDDATADPAANGAPVANGDSDLLPGAAVDLDALLGRCARGSAVAFQTLYDATADAVFSLALRVTRSAALAEEVAQDALVEVWRTAPRFTPAKGSARGWIMTITHRRAVDKVRREQSQTDRVEAANAQRHAAPDQPHDVVVNELQSHWEAQRVRAALDDLTDLQREAINLAYYGGLTHVEVSEKLGVPLGTAKTRLRDGLIRLRDSLGDAV